MTLPHFVDPCRYRFQGAFWNSILRTREVVHQWAYFVIWRKWITELPFFIKMSEFIKKVWYFSTPCFYPKISINCTTIRSCFWLNNRIYFISSKHACLSPTLFLILTDSKGGVRTPLHFIIILLHAKFPCKVSQHAITNGTSHLQPDQTGARKDAFFLRVNFIHQYLVAVRYKTAFQLLKWR